MHEFEAHRKPALMNVQIQLHSCKPPDTITNTFKGFLARATKICFEKYLRAEIEYLIEIEIEYLNIFRQNRHDRKTLHKIIYSFEKKTRSTNNNNYNNNTNKK